MKCFFFILIFLCLSVYNLAQKNYSKEDLDSLLSCGEMSFISHDYRESLSFYKQAEIALEELYPPKNANYFFILNKIYQLNINLSNMAESQTYASKILTVSQSIFGVHHREYAIALQNLGLLYGNTGNYSEAIHYYEEALKIITATDEMYPHIRTELGRIYKNMEDYDNALVNLLESQKSYDTTFGNEHPQYIDNTIELATYYFMIKKYEDAKFYVHEAKNLGDKFHKGTNLYSKILTILASYYYFINEFQEAEKYYLESLVSEKNIGDINSATYASTLDYLGLLYLDIGNYQEAERIFIEALDIKKLLLGETHRSYGETTGNLALTYSNEQNWDKAEEYFLQAKNILQNHIGEYNYPLVDIYISLSYIDIKKNNYEEAENKLITAKRILEKNIGIESDSYSYLLNNFGLLYFSKEDYSKAKEYYLKVDSISKKTSGENNLQYLKILQNLIITDYLLHNDNSLKSGFIRYSKILKDETNKNFEFLSEKQRESYWNIYKSGFEIGYWLNFENNYLQFEKENYNNILFAKGLLLRSTNNIRNAIYASNKPQLIEQYDNLGALRQQITALQSKENADKNYIESLEVRADSLDKALTISSQAYKDLKADILMEWQEIRKQLSSDEVAIEFIHFDLYNKHWTDSTMYCAMILKKNSESPEFIPLFEEKELDAFINQKIDNLYNIHNDKLYQLIWTPLEKHLQGIETVYYSPSGLLNQISFSAIPANSSCLSDKYDLRLVSSTREIVHQKKKTSAQSIANATEYGNIRYDVEDENILIQSANRFKNSNELYASRFVASDTLTRSGWEELTGTAKEVDEIELILKNAQITDIKKYTGYEANEESFKSLSGHSPGIIHIATHGFFLKDEEKAKESGFMQRLGADENHQVFRNPLLRSGLLMAGANRAWLNEDVIEGIEDGILTAKEIANLDLTKTQLVVLSACETGLGEVKNSEGVFGLQRAFKLAGVETLIMSLWKVDDQATSEMMILFYKHWISGKTKQEAFKIAQKEIRAKYEKPYYWAGFVLMD